MENVMTGVAGKKMICPNCGREMNHHADKVMLGIDGAAIDPDLGEAVEELHSCPGCGASVSRHSATGSAIGRRN